MSNTPITSGSSNHNGPAGFVVRIGFLLGMISAIWDGLQRKSDPHLRHARWGARW